MYAFGYQRARSVAEAAASLRADPDAKPISGGMSLLPALKLRLSAPSKLVDLAGIPGLASIAVEGGMLRLGATTPHAKVAGSTEVRRAIPALADLAAGIGDVQVRNRGTIGGSIANADPAACYPAAVLGLGATIRTDRRAIGADAFFKGLFQTALEPAEIVIGVDFPIPDRAAYLKFANQASRFAIVGLFLARFGGTVRVAVTGAASGPFRVAVFEAALAARFAPDALDGLDHPADDLTSDTHAPAEYRAHLIGVLARRAVETCVH